MGGFLNSNKKLKNRLHDPILNRFHEGLVTASGKDLFGYSVILHLILLMNEMFVFHIF